MVFSSKTILAVGAHPDDIELGCAGTLSAANESGRDVVVVFLSKGEKSGDPELRSNESRAALSELGIRNVYFGNFPDTEISGHKVIEFLEGFVDKFKPEVVLTHSINDSHQDHREVGYLSFSAFRNIHKLLAYESPRVTSAFSPLYFTDITGFLKRKWEALKCHKSQREKRYLAYESMIRLASFRGSQVNLIAAEAFEVLRFVEICPIVHNHKELQVQSNNLLNNIIGGIKGES